MKLEFVVGIGRGLSVENYEFRVWKFHGRATCPCLFAACPVFRDLHDVLLVLQKKCDHLNNCEQYVS